MAKYRKHKKLFLNSFYVSYILPILKNRLSNSGHESRAIFGLFVILFTLDNKKWFENVSDPLLRWI